MDKLVKNNSNISNDSYKCIKLNIKNNFSFSKSNKDEDNNYHSNDIIKYSLHTKKNYINLKKQNINKEIIKVKKDLKISEFELIEPKIEICQINPVPDAKVKNINEKKNDINNKIYNGKMVKDLLKIKKIKINNDINKKNKSPDLIRNKIVKYRTKEESNISTRNKNDYISNDLMEFINNAKNNKNNNSSLGKGDICNFNMIKYVKNNTYKEFTKNNRKRKSYNYGIVANSMREKNMSKNESNTSIKSKNIDNKPLNNINDKKRNVNYKRLNKLYLDYKIKSIKRNQLKKEQDIKSGVTFIPHTNRRK
jgi:hypothetical protein